MAPNQWYLTNGGKVLTPGLVHITPVNGEVMSQHVICVCISMHRHGQARGSHTGGLCGV